MGIYQAINLPSDFYRHLQRAIQLGKKLCAVCNFWYSILVFLFQYRQSRGSEYYSGFGYYQIGQTTRIVISIGRGHDRTF